MDPENGRDNDLCRGCGGKGKVAHFRKRPVIIQAYQTEEEFLILTLEGTMRARVGDWVVTGTAGERYPVKPQIFLKTYEPVEP